jgi:hypothetical protein
MRINIDQSAGLTADNIGSHVYDDGSAYLELGTRFAVHQSILIWVGKEDADLAEEAQALRKLAEVACDLAAGLESRTGPPADAAACPDHRPVLDDSAGWYCAACGSEDPPGGDR